MSDFLSVSQWNDSFSGFIQWLLGDNHWYLKFSHQIQISAIDPLSRLEHLHNMLIEICAGHASANVGSKEAAIC